MKNNARPIDANALIELAKNHVDHNVDINDIARFPTIDLSITGDTSDGYHTFNELYHHRAILFSVIVGMFPGKSWKSMKHHDGSMYDGMFIVGIDTPDGQATYHYDVDPYWDMFDCDVLESAPAWDGHTAEQAIERIGNILQSAHDSGNLAHLDMVNRPNHYIIFGDKDCFDVMVELFGADAVQTYCVLNAFTYLFRHARKNGTEDVLKAEYNLAKFKELENESPRNDA